MHNCTVHSANPDYFSTFLKHKNYQTTSVGRIIKVKDFNQYNFLVDINSIFSKNPAGFPIDRTGTINHPVKFNIENFWRIPTQQYSIDEAVFNIVKKIESLNEKINVFWSGGIDSTFIVNSFLKHLTSVDQLRIIYSPWSYYEHPKYLDFLKKYPSVETVDQSGETYLDLQLDGIYITGNSGDEMHASLDQSFFERYGYDTLFMSWKKFFKQQNSTTEFIEFCEKYFSLSGRPIDTVLEARWWFYAIVKNTSFTRESTIPFFTSGNSAMPIDKIYSFFNCQEYENYIYWNIDKILPDNNYHCWKQPLKDYCFNFDHLDDWYNTKIKTHSRQFHFYTAKKTILNNARWLFIMSNGTRIFTDNLPFYSSVEFDEKYSNTLDYVLNEPD
jgi:hypothetical protein